MTIRGQKTFLAVSGRSCRRKWRFWKTIKIYLSFPSIFPRVSDPDVVGNLSYIPELVVLFVGIPQELSLPAPPYGRLETRYREAWIWSPSVTRDIEHNYPFSGFQVRSYNVRRKPCHTILRKCLPLTSEKPQPQNLTLILAISTTILSGTA